MSGSTFQHIQLSGLLLLLLSSCGRPADQDLARHGQVNANAPVQAAAQIVVDAPPERVWNVLADIRNWPAWQPAITSATTSQPPAAGVAFLWSTGAGSIHSRLALFDAPGKLAWTGRLFLFHAIHVWTLTPLPNGQTLVQTRESMSGWPIGWLYSSDDLTSADRDWLAALKKKAQS